MFITPSWLVMIGYSSVLAYVFASVFSTLTTWVANFGFRVLLVVLAGWFGWLILRKHKGLATLLRSLGQSLRWAFATDPEVRRLAERNPKKHVLLQKRLNKTKFSGLPLTLLAAVFLYVLVLLFKVVEGMVTNGAITGADLRIMNLLFVFRDAGLIAIFTWLTLWGKWQVVMAAAVVTIGLFTLWQRRLYIFPLAITVLGSELANFLGKLTFQRPRPPLSFYWEEGFSFPSGHAALAVAFYGFLAYFFWRELKLWRTRLSALLLSLLVITVIGFSRLYLGAHYLSDVLTGHLLGLAWLLVGIGLAEWLRMQYATRRVIISAHKRAKRLAWTLGLMLLLVAFYVGFGFYYQLSPRLITQPVASVPTADAMALFKNGQLPSFTETIAGRHQAPLSFLVVASDDRHLLAALNKAGWLTADSVVAESVWRLAKSAVLNRSYPTAPMTPSFWNTLVHDYGFEKETDASARRRHHARFWRTDLVMPEGRVYVGTASFDAELKWLLVHKISPDIDTERDILFADLQNANTLDAWRLQPFVSPTLGKNFGGDVFFTDGKAYILYLKDRLVAKE